jgi:hypothetical protein
MDIIVIAVVVIIALLAHVALYRWVKFKIHEGVILQYLRDTLEGGAPDHHHADVIAAHTRLPKDRVTHVCLHSDDILQDPDAAGSWRAK